jgi:hypothetical protein
MPSVAASVHSVWYCHFLLKVIDVESEAALCVCVPLILIVFVADRCLSRIV